MIPTVREAKRAQTFTFYVGKPLALSMQISWAFFIIHSVLLDDFWKFVRLLS